MFERYTERARRVIFFARYEASTRGSTTIETEHLLLGLVREDKNVLGRFISEGAEDIPQDIGRRIQARPKISTAIDLPLSEECVSILKYAAEEADQMGHRWLGTEHLLLGMLRVSGMAAQVLKEHKVDLEAAREIIKEVMPPGAPSMEEPAAVDRKTVHALIDQLPEASLGHVKMMLDRSVAGPPGRISTMGFAARFQRDTEGKMKEGRFTSDRHENGAIVSETQHFHHGYQISVTETLRLSENGRKLRYSQEIVGPKPEQQHRHSMEFDVS